MSKITAEEVRKYLSMSREEHQQAFFDDLLKDYRRTPSDSEIAIRMAFEAIKTKKEEK